MKKMLKNVKGFTLVELMVVIVIVGLLAAISVPIYQKYTYSARASEGKALLGAVASAAKVYYAERGAFPVAFTGITGAAGEGGFSINCTQNAYFNSYSFTPGAGLAFTARTVHTLLNGGLITVNLAQAAAGGPAITETLP